MLFMASAINEYLKISKFHDLYGLADSVADDTLYYISMLVKPGVHAHLKLLLFKKLVCVHVYMCVPTP